MQPQQFRFFVLTHRDPRYDFRRPLVDALRQRYDTYYVWLNQRAVISGPNQNDPPVEMSLTQLAGFFLRFRRKDKINIYFNSARTCLALLPSLSPTDSQHRGLVPGYA